MSKKLKRCVRKVDKQKGKSESDAYAICNASINKESKLPRFVQYYSEAKMSATPKGFKDIKVDNFFPIYFTVKWIASSVQVNIFW